MSHSAVKLEDMSVLELKALAFDNVMAIERAKMNLANIERVLAKKPVETKAE